MIILSRNQILNIYIEVTSILHLHNQTNGHDLHLQLTFTYNLYLIFEHSFRHCTRFRPNFFRYWEIVFGTDEKHDK